MVRGTLVNLPFANCRIECNINKVIWNLKAEYYKHWDLIIILNFEFRECGWITATQERLKICLVDLNLSRFWHRTYSFVFWKSSISDLDVYFPKGIIVLSIHGQQGLLLREVDPGAIYKVSIVWSGFWRLGRVCIHKEKNGDIYGSTLNDFKKEIRKHREWPENDVYGWNVRVIGWWLEIKL